MLCKRNLQKVFLIITIYYDRTVKIYQKNNTIITYILIHIRKKKLRPVKHTFLPNIYVKNTQTLSNLATKIQVSDHPLPLSQKMNFP